jgi:2-dehydro-3-deoxygalactonokinase
MIAVDWGTSSLRAYRIGAAGVVSERRGTAAGLLSCDGRFAAVLARQLEGWDDALVLMAGMVGSRSGWREVPYVACPAGLEAIAAGLCELDATELPGRRLFIVPGVSQREAGAPPDVMRGEETQLAGALARLGRGRNVICLPGTHSKWVVVEDGVVTAFQTVMTGELFSLLSSHSILSYAIGTEPPAVDPDSAAFRRGCASGLTDPGGAGLGLFRIRAASLLHGLEAGNAAAVLSGLLIGAEIAACRERFGGGQLDAVTLIASGSMRRLYEQALSLASIEHGSVDADEAVRHGLLAAARHCGFAAEVGR